MRTAIDFLLRTYSYLYHLALSVFLFGLAMVGHLARRPLVLGSLLPWEGVTLNRWVMILGLVGIVMVVLSVLGILRPLFPLWTLFAFVMMFRGFFMTSYVFAGEEAFKGAVYLTIGAFGAFLCSLMVWKGRPRRL